MRSKTFYPKIKDLIQANGKFHDLVEKGFQAALEEKSS